MHNLFVKIKRLARLPLFAALLFVACSEVDPTPQATAVAEPEPTKQQLVVNPFEESTDFKLLYPQGWQYQVVEQGLVTFGPGETIFEGNSGPSVTLFRIPPATVRGDLEVEFNHFLDFGPRRDGYEEIGDIRIVDLNGSDALAVDMIFPGEGDSVPTTAILVGVAAESGAVYVLSGTAPTEIWDQEEVAIQVTINSFELNE